MTKSSQKKVPTTVTLSTDEFTSLMEKAKVSGSGLLVHAKWLRQCASEIVGEEHNGWGNTCLQAAEAIEKAVRRRPKHSPTPEKPA